MQELLYSISASWTWESILNHRRATCCRRPNPTSCFQNPIKCICFCPVRSAGFQRTISNEESKICDQRFQLLGCLELISATAVSLVRQEERIRHETCSKFYRRLLKQRHFNFFIIASQRIEGAPSFYSKGAFFYGLGRRQSKSLALIQSQEFSVVSLKSCLDRYQSSITSKMASSSATPVIAATFPALKEAYWLWVRMRVENLVGQAVQALIRELYLRPLSGGPDFSSWQFLSLLVHISFSCFLNMFST